MHRIGMRAVVFVSFFACADALSQEKPAALRAAERARSHAALRTGRIEWSVTTRLGGTGEKVRFYTSQFAGEDFTMIDRGDEEGVVLRNPDGTPATRYTYSGPRQHLVKADELWLHVGRSSGVDVRPREDRAAWMGIYDVRALGLYPWVDPDDFYKRLRRRGAGAVRWTSEQGEGLHVVTAKLDDGELCWWIDPHKGWNPVRTALLDKDGDIMGENRVKLRKYGETWFPEVIARYAYSYRGGQEPFQEFHIAHASFNAPDDPQTLTPEHIGVEVGMGINFHAQPNKPLQYWDGEKPIPFEELVERMKSGELQYGPTMARELGRTPVSSPGSPSVQDRAADRRNQPKVDRPSSIRRIPSEWEAYTRSFIKKYQLNAEQTQKALSILKSCQERGEAHVSKHKSDFDRLDERVKVFAKLKGEQRAKAEAQIKRDREKLLKPLDDIFERQLKPRLEKLPTRAQRKAVDQSEKVSQQSKETEAKTGENP